MKDPRSAKWIQSNPHIDPKSTVSEVVPQFVNCLAQTEGKDKGPQQEQHLSHQRLALGHGDPDNALSRRASRSVRR